MGSRAPRATKPRLPSRRRGPEPPRRGPHSRTRRGTSRAGSRACGPGWPTSKQRGSVVPPPVAGSWRRSSRASPPSGEPRRLPGSRPPSARCVISSPTSPRASRRSRPGSPAPASGPDASRTACRPRGPRACGPPEARRAAPRRRRERAQAFAAAAHRPAAAAGALAPRAASPPRATGPPPAGSPRA